MWPLPLNAGGFEFSLPIFFRDIAAVMGVAVALIHGFPRQRWRFVVVLVLSIACGKYCGRLVEAAAWGWGDWWDSGFWIRNVASVFAIDFWRGSGSVLGVILGFLLGGFLGSVLLGLSPGRTLDSFAPAAATAQAVGRLGCFANGCCFGTPTGASWGVMFHPMSVAGLTYGPQRLHPTQIYEALLDGLLAIYLILSHRRCHEEWRIIGAYLVGYGLVRILVHAFRPDGELGFMGILKPQLLAAGLVAIGLYALFLSVQFDKY